MLQAGRVVLASRGFLGHSQIFQEYQLPLEILEDQEPLVAQEVPPCLDKFPLVCLGALEDPVVQHLQSLHSGQGALGPLELLCVVELELPKCLVVPGSRDLQDPPLDHEVRTAQDLQALLVSP